MFRISICDDEWHELKENYVGKENSKLKENDELIAFVVNRDTNTNKKPSLPHIYAAVTVMASLALSDTFSLAKPPKRESDHWIYKIATRLGEMVLLKKLFDGTFVYMLPENLPPRSKYASNVYNPFAFARCLANDGALYDALCELEKSYHGLKTEVYQQVITSV